jgi:hypothetical protein
MTGPSWLRVRRLDDVGRQEYLATVLLLWATLLLCLLLDAVAFQLLNIGYDGSGWDDLVMPAAVLPLGILYSLFRFDALLSSIFKSIAFLGLITPLLIAYTYITAALGTGAPLYDPWFDRIDQILGLDWISYLLFANSLAEKAPALATVTEVIYGSLPIQLFAVLLVLPILGQYERLQIFCLTFVIGVLIVGAAAGVFPAVGTYDFYRIDPSMHPHLDLVTKSLHLKQYISLRDGTFTTFSIQHAKGIITFPSFHTTLAIFFIWAMWRVPVLRWISLLVNICMIAVTPLHGSHFFTDLIAGAAVAPISIVAAEALRRRSGAWLHLGSKLVRRASTLTPVTRVIR